MEGKCILVSRCHFHFLSSLISYSYVILCIYKHIKNKKNDKNGKRKLGKGYVEKIEGVTGRGVEEKGMDEV